MKIKLLVFIFILLSLTSCATMESSFEKAKAKNTIEAYEKFLSYYSKGVFAAEAQIRLEHLYYKKAESQNTIVAYEEFLKKFPNAEYSNAARREIERLYFKEAKFKNTIKAYEDYIERYPSGEFSEFRRKAEENIMIIHYNEALVKDTFDAYIKFLELYPYGKYAQEILSRIRKLAFPNIKSAKIIVNQSYGTAKGVNLPFEGLTKDILKYVGIKAAEPDCKNFDMTIKINAEGYASGRRFSEPSSDKDKVIYLYTSASLNGEIILELPNITVPVYQTSFSGRSTAGGMPSSSVPIAVFRSPLPKKPSDAPFGLTLDVQGSFKHKLLEMIFNIYGLDPLIAAVDDLNFSGYSMLIIKASENPRRVDIMIEFLKNHRNYVREGAAYHLGYIRDPRAIEPLIVCLNDEDNIVRREAAKSLTWITGKNFGEDYNKWIDWWKNNKSKYKK